MDELLGTKLRALYQRKKGRDLFDQWVCKSTLAVDPERVVHSFIQYMNSGGVKVSRVEFEENLFKKLEDAAFREDIQPLLRANIAYDIDEAAKYVINEILGRLPGDQWKGAE